MFEEYVEGDAGPSKVLPLQGFEDGGVYSHDESALNESQEPVFSIGRVQFSPPSPIHAIVCKNNRLVIACHGLPRPAAASGSANGGKQPHVMSIDLDKPSQIESVDLPVALPALTTRLSSLKGVFVDPTGKHAIVGTHTGENYYIYLGPLSGQPQQQQPPRKPRLMSKFKGAVIESVAWNLQATSTSTREILLGTALGQLVETALVDPQLADSTAFSIPGRSAAPERYFKHVLSLPERVPITGLHVEMWSSKKLAVIATTQTRIYQFVASTASTRRDDESPCFEPALSQYASGEVQPKILDLPGEGSASELHVFAQTQSPTKARPAGLALPQSMAWLAGPGIYHGRLSFPSSNDAVHPGDGIIESASLVPFPSGPIKPTHVSSTVSSPVKQQQQQITETPKSMALTEWHFVVLYEEKIKAVSLLSDKVVFESDLNLPVGEEPIKLTMDPMRKTCWMYTNQSIYEITIRDEDRDVWRVYLSRSNFDLARRHAKTERQRNDVMTAEADAHFAAGRFIQAAQSYAQSSARFEDIALRFIDRDERDALRYYLVARLERLKKTDVIQRLMLATWLVEIFLGKMNELDDVVSASARVSDDADNLAVERSILEDDVRQFLATYKDVVDHKTVFELIDAHGRDELMLYFADVVGDRDRICEHHVVQEDWAALLDTVIKADDFELFVKHATVLVANVPDRFLDALRRRHDVDVRRLLPSLTRHIETRATRSIVRYLDFVIKQQYCDDTAVFHTLLTLMAASPSAVPESELVAFLSSSSADSIETGEPLYDLDYALRVCRSNKRLQACVIIYSKMGMYEASVDLALQNEDVELAKLGADKPEDDEVLRKNLWLKVAEYVVRQKQDIKTAVQFLSSTDLLKIEDILPFFPDFVVIDDFKDEICNALESYSAHIEQLKADMDEAARSAEAIKSDIADLRQRFVVVEADDKCASCARPLLTRQFYVFPCQHAMHADCLIRHVADNLAPSQLKRMLDLQTRLSTPSSAVVTNGREGKRRNGLLDSESTLLTSRKIAAASVQGLDSLRKLVLPDALLGAVSSALPGTLTSRHAASSPAKAGRDQHLAAEAEENDPEKAELRRQLDEMIASSCVLCEGAIQNIDRPFTVEGETM